MAREISKLSDGSKLEYDRGKFDDWCVYLVLPNKTRRAPQDVEYFNTLSEIGAKYGNQKIYDDFVQIYELTTSQLDVAVFDTIKAISEKYGEDSLKVEIALSTIYAAMVAEENKAFTKLKKRIKRLGIHQFLLDEKDVNYAAKFSYGKKWWELDAIMKNFGF